MFQKIRLFDGQEITYYVISECHQEICGRMKSVIISRIEVEHTLVQFVAGVSFKCLNVFFSQLMILDSGQKFTQPIISSLHQETFIPLNFTQWQNFGVCRAHLVIYNVIFLIIFISNTNSSVFEESIYRGLIFRVKNSLKFLNFWISSCTSARFMS